MYGGGALDLNTFSLIFRNEYPEYVKISGWKRKYLGQRQENDPMLNNMDIFTNILIKTTIHKQGKDFQHPNL